MSSLGGSTPVRQGRGENVESPLSAAAAVSTASVLSNRDLLTEILLRVDSPAWLVRAALASKSWLRVASDPAFLDRFRAIQPPRVLGISDLRVRSSPHLIPVPQPPELAAAARLASRAVGNLWGSCADYCNGRLLMETRDSRNKPSYAVASLLDEAREKKILLPPPPQGSAGNGSGLFYYSDRMLLLEDDGHDATSCLYLSMVCDTETVHTDFSILRSGVWGVPQTAVSELKQEPCFTAFGDKLVSGEKVYMMTTAGSILALDLATATFSAIELPDGAEHCGSIKFGRTKQSGLYLVCATGFQLRVWHGDGAGQWALVDTISVCEACAQLNVQAWVPHDKSLSPVWIVGVTDNAEFVILELVASRIVCCMQLGNRAVAKMAKGVRLNIGNFVHPITMVWPPFRPVPPALE